MSYHREIHNVRTHIATLRLALLALTLLAVFMGWGWHNAPRYLTVHIPPDLRAGSLQPAHEVPQANVYAFAYYIWQQLHRWPEDGHQDYGRNVFRLSAFLTPAFRAQLTRDIEERGRRGELLGRVRTAREAVGAGFEPRRVEVVRDGDAWVVWLDLEITESVRGMNVKHTQVRYPLRVVRYDVDREKNPWGLALAGFASAPARIDADSQEERP
ncbi:MAG: TIGR03746 family integrating conjugative element protein [Thioalkalivibrio sp.]|jgi:integrating conjugative element protein (TIGR03746 family)|nr:MAG: TIGR03746 family integrating conjugative element protein [Thioalkalivibrio sp.]